jgi:hypothetical protein
MNRVTNAAIGVLLLFITSLLSSSGTDAFVVPTGIGRVNCGFDAGQQRHPPPHQLYYQHQSKLTIMLMTHPPTTKTTDNGSQLPPPTSKRERLLEYIRRFRTLLDDEVWSKHNVSPMQVVRDTAHDQETKKQQRSGASSHPEEVEEEDELLSVNNLDGNNNLGTLLDNVSEEQTVVQIEVVNIDSNSTLIAPFTTNDTATTTTTLSSRQTQSANHVDLSGIWKPIVTEKFKKEYDAYLTNCSQPYLFRKLLVNGIVFQKEYIRQLNNGQSLEIIATNPAGNWNRTLLTSSFDIPNNVTIVDPDGDTVYIEAYWINNGTQHKSILRGKPNVEGGYFETVRYLEQPSGSSRGSNNHDNNNNDMRREEDVLICESKFYPPPSTWQSNSKEFNYGQVVWRFERDQ